jgi:PPM family protein phosphatase
LALRIADHASRTDVGRQRHTNEDDLHDKPPVFAVADGMGGAQAGEVASKMAIEEFIQERDPDTEPEERLRAIITAANKKIWEMAQQDSRQAGMGTTLTAVIVGDHDVAVGHVGDSRLYLARNGTLERLTRDHSLVEEFVRQGRLTPEQAEKHPQRSVITRALGPEPEVEVDTFTVQAKDGDVFLLCSDGLSGMVSDSDLQEILSEGRPLEQIANELVERANEKGGRDNITAVVFRLEEDGTGDRRRTDTESYETIVGDVQAPSTEQIEEARAASSQSAESSSQIVGSSQLAEGASGRASPVDLPAPSSHLRPRRATRRGRLYAKAAAVTVVLLLIVGGGLYVVTKNVWFLGTNDEGVITLYRGLPYELPLGINLYQQNYVSGVPALSLPADRRKRILDHQLRSRSDAVDLIRNLDLAESR